MTSEDLSQLPQPKFPAGKVVFSSSITDLVERGRFDPATGAFVQVDPASENSPLIDAGDPAASVIVTNEPPPNGRA